MRPVKKAEISNFLESELLQKQFWGDYLGKRGEGCVRVTRSNGKRLALGTLFFSLPGVYSVEGWDVGNVCCMLYGNGGMIDWRMGSWSIIFDLFVLVTRV
jgi:hypothetical protein